MDYMHKRYFPIAILTLLAVLLFAAGAWTNKLFLTRGGFEPVALTVVYACDEDYFGSVVTLANGHLVPLTADKVPESALERRFGNLGPEHIAALIVCPAAPQIPDDPLRGNL